MVNTFSKLFFYSAAENENWINKKEKNMKITFLDHFLPKEYTFQEIPGKIELIRSRSGDSFKLYFHGDEENWYYMDYKLGTLNVTTTDIPFYNILTDVKAKKRKIKSEDGSRYMYQAMPSRKRRNDLVDEYRDFD